MVQRALLPFRFDGLASMSLTVIKHTVATILLCFYPTLASADAICKTEPVPLDYVVTAEFNSPQCDDGNNPLAVNAWEVEKARDGIAVCRLPDYQSIGARVASLIPCGRTDSAACPSRIDGLPNAIVLRSPNSCASIRPLPKGFSVHCFPIEPERPAPPPHPYGRWGFRVGVVSVAQCNNVDLILAVDDVSRPNAWLFRDEATSSKDRPDTVCAGWSDNLILRRFFNPYCPAKADTPGAEDGLTGWVVMGQWLELSNGQQVTFCIGRNFPETTSVRSRGGGPPRLPTPDRATHYDPLCGGSQNVSNAYRMTWGRIGWNTPLQ